MFFDFMLINLHNLVSAILTMKMMKKKKKKRKKKKRNIRMKMVFIITQNLKDIQVIPDEDFQDLTLEDIYEEICIQEF